MELAEAIVEFIRLRTLGGLDKNNRKFAKYSKDYAAFKGVSRDSVDLSLSSEMLEALTVLSHKSGEVVIGYEKDDPLNGRAEGNIKGTYGQPSPVTKPRDFLGITKTDLLGILSGIGNNRDEEVEVDIDEVARKAAGRIIDGLKFDDQGD